MHNNLKRVHANPALLSIRVCLSWRWSALFKMQIWLSHPMPLTYDSSDKDTPWMWPTRPSILCLCPLPFTFASYQFRLLSAPPQTELSRSDAVTDSVASCHMSCSPGLLLHAPVCPIPIHPLFLSLIIVSSDNPALLSLTRPKSPAVVSQNHVLSLGLFSPLWFYLCIYVAIWWPHPLNDKLHGVPRPYLLLFISEYPAPNIACNIVRAQWIFLQ